ncbi:hypothetical protein [Salarchaeum japonicum]|uniref:SPW repeat-containing protein n=1 Tax=Salarchaeum japonicum TaxID=555573 RepID=A0AAV3T171_9EURY|nr:hypothetical protein [Salarchaeum japonicum]
MQWPARWFAVVGGVLAVAGVGLLVAFTPSGIAALQPLALALAGVLMVLVGVPNPVRDAVGWHRLVGLADIALGATLVLGSLLSDPVNLWYVAISAIGGGSLALIGFDYIRGGHWFDISTDAP